MNIEKENQIMTYLGKVERLRKKEMDENIELSKKKQGLCEEK